MEGLLSTGPTPSSFFSWLKLDPLPVQVSWVKLYWIFAGITTKCSEKNHNSRKEKRKLSLNKHLYSGVNFAAGWFWNTSQSTSVVLTLYWNVTSITTKYPAKNLNSKKERKKVSLDNLISKVIYNNQQCLAFTQYRIRGALNILTNADSSTNIFFYCGPKDRLSHIWRWFYLLLQI